MHKGASIGWEKNCAITPAEIQRVVNRQCIECVMSLHVQTRLPPDLTLLVDIMIFTSTLPGLPLAVLSTKKAMTQPQAGLDRDE